MLSLKSVRGHPLLEEECLGSNCFSDVWVRGSTEQTARSHRFVLGAVSSCLAEAFKDVPGHVEVLVSLPDVSQETIKLILQFTSCEMLMLSETSYMALLELMQMLNIDYLGACHVVMESDDLDISSTNENFVESFSGEELVGDDCSFNEHHGNAPTAPPVKRASFISRRGGGTSNFSGIDSEFGDPSQSHSDKPVLFPVKRPRGQDANGRTFIVKRETVDSELSPADGGDLPADSVSSALGFCDNNNDAEHAELMFTCVHCEKCFSTNSFLEKHIKRYHTVGVFKCSECNYSSSVKGNLKSHVARIHEKVRNFACSECEKTFSTKCILDNHIASIHRKVKQFSCEFCNSDFYTQASLMMHAKTHTSEKPFCCSRCGKRFSTARAQEQHKFTCA